MYSAPALEPGPEAWTARAQVRHAAERQREGLQRRLAAAETALRAAQSGLAEAQHERQARAPPCPCPALARCLHAGTAVLQLSAAWNRHVCNCVLIGRPQGTDCCRV